MKEKKSHNIAVSDTLWSILAEKCILPQKLNTYMCVCEREREKGREGRFLLNRKS